jgi:hypothetical protein
MLSLSSPEYLLTLLTPSCSQGTEGAQEVDTNVSVPPAKRLDAGSRVPVRVSTRVPRTVAEKLAAALRRHEAEMHERTRAKVLGSRSQVAALHQPKFTDTVRGAEFDSLFVWSLQASSLRAAAG